MPTVSAARGCSPTARVRRPQRDRNSQIWVPTMITIADIAIGPWLRNIAKIQPTTGRSVSTAGGVKAAKLPAPAGDDFEISWSR